MRRIWILSVVAGLCASAGGATAEAARAATAAARIVVDPAARSHPVSPLVFGANHRYAFDGFGMWDPAADAAFPSFVTAFNRAGFTSVRFPGGTIANRYHWKRAIGPVSERTPNVHGRTREPLTNTFGPDEFGRFVEQVGAEGTIVVNFGTGTASEAADWVEYMNAPVGTNPRGGTAWADVRAANGHAEPYGIHYWEVGNEHLHGLGQSYWMGNANILEKYVFGGTTAFAGQRVGTPYDQRDSASVSDGSPSMSFEVWYPPIEPGTLRVFVDEKEWARVDDLGRAGAEDVFTTDPASGSIRFGDGTHGNVPPAGSVVTASYVSGPHDGFNAYYSAMKSVDPTITVASSIVSDEFLATMGTTHPYDAVVRHPKSGKPTGWTTLSQLHDAMMTIPRKHGREVAELRRDIDAYAGSRGSSIEILITEYGMTFNAVRGYLLSMDQALYTALELREWIRHGVPLAQKHSLIDLDPKTAPIGSTSLGPPAMAIIGPKPAFVVSATAKAMRLLTRMTGTTKVSQKTYRNPTKTLADGREMKLLQSLATVGPKGTTYLLVVNRAIRKSITAKIAHGGRKADVIIRSLTSPSFRSYNTVDDPNAVLVTSRRRDGVGEWIRYTFAPHSVTTFRFDRP
ncbi:MAG: hypothetical protein KY396_07260 [Actinobacteria bacterium]|nr:hypothetical protein [Actinomycetota bacterium]